MILTKSICLGISLLMLVSVGCEGAYEDVRVTVFDYRFTPNRLHVGMGKPVRLIIRNQGREVHRFKSSLVHHLELPTLPGQVDAECKPQEGASYPNREHD